MSSSTSSNSPCAACKFLRRKCTLNCVFAPYFPPDQPSKFANVHRVFGASNVAKLLADLSLVHREDAVNSLAYEANARLRDPVYGCIGEISQLQHRLKCIQIDLFNAKKELAQYMGGTNNTLPAQFLTGGGVVVNNQNQNHHQNQIQIIQQHGFHGGVVPTSGIGVPQPQQPQSRILLHEQQQHLIEAMQMATAAAREQELFRGFDQHQHQLDEYARYAAAAAAAEAAVGVEGGENGNFNQIGNVRVLQVSGEQQSGLGLVPQGFNNTIFQLHQHQQLQQQQHQQYYRDQHEQEEQKVECEEEEEQQRQRPAHDHHRRTGSDKDRSSGGSVIGPSC